MKRSITLLIALALAIVLTVPALGEEKNDFAGFQPFEEPVKIKTVIGYSEADIPDAGVLPSTCEWNSMVKDYLNIEFDWMWEVPTSQYRTKLDLALSSGQYPDILKCDFETMNYLKEADMLADLTDVWEQYASAPLRAVLDPYLYTTTDENGKLYAIPYANNVAGEMHVTFWRKDWLDNLGLDVPTNLEEYTAAIKAMRDGDPDGNGIKDTYGICFWSDLFASRFGMNSVFNAFGAYPGTWIERDGTIVRGDIQPEVKEALDYLRELYAGGYIPPEFATHSRDQAISQIVSGQIGQYGGKWFVPDYAVVIDNMKDDVNADWFCIAMPGMTDDAPAVMSVPQKTASDYNVVLKTASEEAKIGMIKLLNLFYDINFYADVEHGGSGNTYWFSLDPESEEYQAHRSRHFAWWPPVNIWNPSANFDIVKLLDNYQATGEWDDNIYALTQENKTYWEKAFASLEAGRDACTTEAELDVYLDARKNAICRFDSDYAGECALTIVDKLMKSGNTELAIYYGPETETGVAVSSTLSDLFTQYICRYIMGLEAEDSFDTFVANWNAMGGEAWTAEVNAAYNASR